MFAKMLVGGEKEAFKERLKALPDYASESECVLNNTYERLYTTSVHCVKLPFADVAEIFFEQKGDISKTLEAVRNAKKAAGKSFFER